MHELEGSPVDVIARTLGVTSVTVRWHLSKGRRSWPRRYGVKGARHEGPARLVERSVTRSPTSRRCPTRDVQRMRQAIVAAADESHQWSFADWARGSWAAATVVVALTIAVGMSRWMHADEDMRWMLTRRPPRTRRRPGRAGRCS